MSAVLAPKTSLHQIFVFAHFYNQRSSKGDDITFFEHQLPQTQQSAHLHMLI